MRKFACFIKFKESFGKIFGFLFLSVDERNSWNETLHLVESDKNRKRLDDAIAEMKKNK